MDASTLIGGTAAAALLGGLLCTVCLPAALPRPRALSKVTMSITLSFSDDILERKYVAERFRASRQTVFIFCSVEATLITMGWAVQGNPTSRQCALALACLSGMLVLRELTWRAYRDGTSAEWRAHLVFSWCWSCCLGLAFPKHVEVPSL